MATGGNNPIPQAQALTTALQPANVQMAILVDLMKKLADETAKTTKVKNEEIKAHKQNSANILEMLGAVKTGVKAAMVTAAGAVTSMIGLVSSTLGGFVGAFRPDVMARFKIVTDDLMASIGEILVPVMQLATRGFRWLADTIVGLTSTVLPLINGVISAMEPLLQMFGDYYRQLINLGVIKGIFDQLGAAIELITAVANPLLPTLLQVVKIIESFQMAIVSIFTIVVKAATPLIAAFAQIGDAIATVLLAPLKILAAVIGPLIQLALLPLTIALQLLAVPFRILAAVIDPIGKLIGELANTVASILGAVVQTLADVVGLIGKAVGEVLKVLFDFLKPAFEWFAKGLMGMALALKDFVDFSIKMINRFRAAIGLAALESGGEYKPGDSRNKSAQAANFTSTDEVWKNLMKQTFGAGRGEPMVKEQQTTNKILGDISKKLDDQKNESGAPETKSSDDGLWGMDRDMWRGQELRKG